jgi:hypothetical protein
MTPRGLKMLFFDPAAITPPARSRSTGFPRQIFAPLARETRRLEPAARLLYWACRSKAASFGGLFPSHIGEYVKRQRNGPSAGASRCRPFIGPPCGDMASGRPYQVIPGDIRSMPSQLMRTFKGARALRP